MTAPALPNGMIPVCSGYASDDPGGVLRTEVAGGAARYALDWDQGPQRYAVTIILTAVEFSVWNAFFFHIIKKGAISFTMPIDSGFGVAAHLGNIMPGSYSTARLDGPNYSVAFSFETTNQAYDMTDSDAQALIDLYNALGDSSSALLAALAHFALVDSLVLAI